MKLERLKGKDKKILVHHTGIDAEQHFSARLVQRGLAEGWMTIGQGTLTLHATPEDLVYTILRPPGRWCVHCEQKLEDDGSGAKARAHVAGEHAGIPSPDARYPAGYAWPTHWKVTLSPAQHEKFRHRPRPAAKKWWQSLVQRLPGG